MDENITNAFYALHSSLEHLQDAIEKKFNNYDQDLQFLQDKILELENTNSKHKKVLCTIANVITEEMKE